VNAQRKKSWLAIGVIALVIAGALAVNLATRKKSDDTGSAASTRQIAQANLPDCPTTTGTSPVDGGLPSLTLPCLGNGPKVDLAKLRGPIVVNIWAGPCPPCQAEAPLIQQFYAAAAGKVAVLGVVDGAYPDDPNDALNAARGLGLHYPSLFDAHGKLVESVRTSGIPTTLFVDAHGALVHTEIGQLKAGDLEKLAKQYLGVDVET
jgi:cytochrome c biogenesis protein CcmG, thiol:disulfide interchange protein DsbE